ncbi:DUF803-domain-containing protein [Polychaeton citri CBS 116435]|uniref:DUF803-domain-containing protein n=1 Tax=Polychaeton citri CBS 116435 TaxID=1314669 RepID=A0A9P4UMK0_9PEZI|nr:DUF803-domain-containing protein [Polychaeton citri CBS 116435]
MAPQDGLASLSSSLVTLNPTRSLTASSDTSRNWSSIIGIVVAICGNVLISFALNTQRYAHMRLRRERDERQEKVDAAKKRKQARGYGTHQSGIGQPAEVGEDDGIDNGATSAGRDDQDAHESEPLLPQHSDSKKPSNAASSGTEGYDEKDDGEQKAKSYLKSPIWWLGIGMMTVGEAGNFLAYGFAPASIVSPMGVVALVSNCLIAPLLLHERFRVRDGLGVVIAVAGCVTIVLSANDSNPRLDQDRIWYLITQWEFETYLGLTLFMIIVLMFVSNKYGEKTILIDVGLVGLFGGYTALSTKGVASLLSNKIWRVVEFPITYLLVAVLIATAVMQIKYINRALQHFNSTQVIPTQFVLFTISVILGSAILYRDFERTTADQATKFVGGCALTFLGVWCITSGRRDEHEHDEEEGHSDQEDSAGVRLSNHSASQPETQMRDGSNADGKRLSVASTATSSSRSIAARTRTVDQSIPSLSVTPDVSALSKSIRERPSLPSIGEHQPLGPAAQNISGASAAAIHSDLTQIPTSSTQDLTSTSPGIRDLQPPQPPKMHATTSEPLLPTTYLAASARLKTPLNRAQSGHPASPSPSASKQRSSQAPTTPQRERAAFLDPTTPASGQRTRHSIAGLLPGPLMSPLSGSLSAIVADSLRRGVDNPHSTLRRGPSSRGQVYTRRRTGGLEINGESDNMADVMGMPTPAAAAGTGKRHSIASGDLDLEGPQALGSGSGSGRQRSMSEALGELFHVGRSGSANTPPTTEDNDNENRGSERNG